PLSRGFCHADHRVAPSNQFFSKTTRNLAENPFASVLLIDPLTFDEYRLFLKYERTERRGPLFDRMEADIEAVAAITGMSGIFKLKSSDIYRVVQLEREPTYS